MGANSLIAIGGCHIAGFGIAGHPTFVDLLSNDLSASCIYRKGYFQLKKVPGLAPILQQHDPEMVLLQLGNFEFHASFKKLFLSKKSTGSDLSSGTTAFTAPVQEVEQKTSFLKKAFECLSLPFISRYLLWKNKPYLQQLQQLIRNYPHIQFLILSPIPCYKYSDNYVRKCGGKRMKRMTAELPNVLFVDLFKKMPYRKEHYLDQAHLNAQGHEALSLLLSRSLRIRTEPVFTTRISLQTSCLTGA